MKNSVNLVKVPGPIRLLCGGTLAYWLSHIINPAFVAIAVMIVLFIPVFLSNYFYVLINAEQSDKQYSPNQPIKGTLMDGRYQSTTQYLKGDENINTGVIEEAAEKVDKSGLSRAKLTR